MRGRVPNKWAHVPASQTVMPRLRKESRPMKRRITAVLIAIVFAVTMSISVFSARTTEIHAIYQEPRIEIVVPSTGQMWLNPRSLPVQINGNVEYPQIVNIPWSIENHSEVGIKVDAAVSARVASGSGIELSGSSVKNSKSKEKRIFLFLDMKVTNPGVDVGALDWGSTVYDSKRHMLITDYGNERANIMTLAPTNLDGTLANGGIGAFHLDGNVNPDPLGGWNPAKDMVTVKIVFTFRPTDFHIP